MNYILAIDIGTTNCKAIVFDEAGKAVCTRKGNYQTITDDKGKSEQNPDELFDVVVRLIKESLSEKENINAVSFSAAMHSLLAVDLHGKPLTNAILWSDTRAKMQAERLKQTEVGKLIYQNTGVPVHPMSPLCKIIWLKETLPDVFANTHKFISIKEYIFFKLFGKYIIDDSIASATGLYNIYKTEWFDRALEQAGITADHLSKPVEVTHQESNLLPKYKNIISAQPTIVFIAGGNDGCLANLGSGVLSSGDASLTIGTSGAIRLTTGHPKPDDAQRLFTYLLTRDIFVTGGAINNGGITLEWLSGIITNDDTPKQPDDLLQLAEKAPAGSDKLLFLPYLLGERAPMWDAAAKGVLFGLTQQHTKEHIARATMEGICFAMRNVMVAIEEVNGNIKTIYASGGFTQSSFWLQMMADVLNKTITVNNSADASSTGAAIIGLYSMGYIRNLSELNHGFAVQKTFTPNASAVEIYQSLFPVFQSLYVKLKDDFVSLDEI